MTGTAAVRTEGFVTVTEDVFYAAMGPLDVNPRPERDVTYWEAPNRELLGISTPGFSAIGEKTYKVRTALAAAKPTGDA